MKTILLIDDDALFSGLIRQTLVNDFNVVLANDVYQAMAQIDQRIPDLIVLDILMPANNGLNLLNELMSFQDTVAVPVIICSSVANELNQEVLALADVVKVLDKTTMQPTDILNHARYILYGKSEI